MDKPLTLTAEEIDMCRVTFLRFDKDRSGSIDLWELRTLLESMDQSPTEDELFRMIAEVDADMSGSIDFSEFLRAIESQKRYAGENSGEGETLDAFVACGGKQDKTGEVQTERLVRIVRDDFQLEVEIEEILANLDAEGRGAINFEQFASLFDQ